MTLHEKVYPGVTSNIKLAKLILLKGIWLSKLDLEQSNEELRVGYNIFNELFEG